MANALLLCAFSFLLIVPWGNRVAHALLLRGIGKRIRANGPASHGIKAGTATMGGAYFVIGLTVIVVALRVAGQLVALLPLAGMLAFGLLGAFDDLRGLSDADGVGWLARKKFPVQWALAILLALAVHWVTDAQTFVLPVLGHTASIGWWVVPVAAVTIVATSNAVNITDGLDGLAAGTSAIAYAAFGWLALATNRRDLAAFCFVVVGALLAFLWYNAHPARMFMGDTGSQALGAGLALVALMSGQWLLLPIVGIVLVAETCSVALQVGYFKWTRRRYGEGRRVFRMAPFHHHYEQGGWSEEQITVRFWLVSIVAAMVGVGLATGWS